MNVKDQIRGEIESHLKAAREVAAKAENESRALTPDERTIIQTAFESTTAAKARLAEIDGDEQMMKQLNALGLEPGQLAKEATIEAARKGITTGAKFTDAPRVKDWMSSLIPSGGRHIGKDTPVHSPQVQFGGVKDILAGSNVTDGPGLLVQRQELGLVDAGLYQRQLTIRSLVTQATTNTDTIHWVKELAHTNNADFVAEARGALTSTGAYVSGTGNVSGIAPMSSFTLQEGETSVKDVKHWIPVTKRALSDAAQIRSLIDNFLSYGLEERLEDSMLTGDGTGQEFEGILEEDGIQHQVWDTNLLVTTRKAKTKVRTVGKATATAFLFNPEDNETIDLLRDRSGGDDNSGAFLFGSPAGTQQSTLWGIPRIESEAIPVGTGLVADWRRAILWDREQSGIQLSDQHLDFFIRGLVAILAELRAAFVVMRPAAFVEIDMSSGAS